MLREKPKAQPLTELEYNYSDIWLKWFDSLRDIVNATWLRLSAYIVNYHTPVYITSASSPVTLTEGQYKIVANTDGGAITINLPTLPFNHGFKIKNAGSSGNNITLSSVSTIEEATIYDGESADLEGDSTEGWVWT